MKKLTSNWIILILISVIIFSCESKDQFLDKPALNEFTEPLVWNDISLIETFVNSIYRNSLGQPFSIMRLSDLSDESFFPPDWGTSAFNKSDISSKDLACWNVDWASPHLKHFKWDAMYINVRRANLFFSKIDNRSYDNQELVYRLKGEVYFLRAWTYASLVALYGGVPIITKAYELNDNFLVSRNSYNDCIKYIVGQLDSATMYLPLKYASTNLAGRATKGAALALKSRVLLYAASDLHNPLKNSIISSGYSKPELIGYISGDVQTRWKLAKDAAKAVMELGIYDLYKKNPLPRDSVAQNIEEFFLSKETEEDILLQYFTTNTSEDWNGYNPGLYSGTTGYHCWANNTPLGDLVDDYEMKDGSSFNWNNPIHKASPYSNRDARFYATILYEGAKWRKRTADLFDQDPIGKIQVGFIKNQANNFIKYGLDNRRSAIDIYSGPNLSYFLRKFIDPTVDPTISKQDIPFKHIRYTEILLNYAEACIELGEDAEARAIINLIRKRAGQPELSPSLTGDDLRKAYRHERRIEMAFEDQRFWDVRRWMIGPEAYHITQKADIYYHIETTSDDQDFTKFFIPPSGYTGKRSDNYLKSDGTNWSAPVFEPRDFDYRSWNNKCYFLPIEKEEIEKNNQLIQNPEY